MGDNLAQQLYTTFIDATSSVAGGDVPNWASLPIEEREHWETVATKARGYMLDQVFGSLRGIETDFNWTEQELVVSKALREKWGR